MDNVNYIAECTLYGVGIKEITNCKDKGIDKIPTAAFPFNS